MQVFLLELLVPFVPYSALSFVPVRIITGVPEIVCLSLVSTQAAVCVLAQMRYLLPLVLFSMAPDRLAATAPETAPAVLAESS